MLVVVVTVFMLTVGTAWAWGTKDCELLELAAVLKGLTTTLPDWSTIPWKVTWVLSRF